MSSSQKPAPKLLHFLLAGGLVAVGLFGAKALVDGRKEIVAEPPEILPPLVEVQVVEPVNRRLDVRTEGEVTALDQVNLSAQVSGTALEVAPELITGGFVSRDQVLVRIDPSDYQLALESALASLAEGQASLTLEEAQAASALREWEAVSDAPPSALVQREPQLAAARARIATAQAGVAKARLDLERTELRAPFNARVLTEDIDRGQLVAQGQPVATLVSTEAVEIPVSLTERDLEALALPTSLGLPGGALGPAARIEPTGTQSPVQWVGQVVRTGGQLDARTRTRTAFVRVEAPYGDPVGSLNHEPLLLGTFVRVHLQGRELEDVIALPRKALKRGDEIYRVTYDEELGSHVLKRHNAAVLAESADELLLSQLTGDYRLRVDFTADADQANGPLLMQLGLAFSPDSSSGSLQPTTPASETRLPGWSYTVDQVRGELADVESRLEVALGSVDYSFETEALRLEPGDLLVTSSLEVVVDGMPVRVASATDMASTTEGL